MPAESNVDTGYLPPIDFNNKGWESFAQKETEDEDNKPLEEGLFYNETHTINNVAFQFNYQPTETQLEQIEEALRNKTLNTGINVLENFPNLAIHIANSPERIERLIRKQIEEGKSVPLGLWGEAVYRRNFVAKRVPSEEDKRNGKLVDVEETNKLGIRSLIPSNLNHDSESTDPNDNQRMLEQAARQILNAKNPFTRLPEGFACIFDTEKNYVEVFNKYAAKTGGGKIRVYVNDVTRNNLSPTERNVKHLTFEIGGKEIEIPIEQWGCVVGFLRPEKGITKPYTQTKEQKPPETTKPNVETHPEPKDKATSKNTETDEIISQLREEIEQMKLIIESLRRNLEESEHTTDRWLQDLFNMFKELETSQAELAEKMRIELEKILQAQRASSNTTGSNPQQNTANNTGPNSSKLDENGTGKDQQNGTGKKPGSTPPPNNPNGSRTKDEQNNNTNPNPDKTSNGPQSKNEAPEVTYRDRIEKLETIGKDIYDNPYTSDEDRTEVVQILETLSDANNKKSSLSETELYSTGLRMQEIYRKTRSEMPYV